MIRKKVPFLFYGGDYNPDQWTEEIWDEDIRILKKMKMNIVTLPVFSWAKLQPNEDTFDFKWLDEIIDRLYKNGISVVMATPTAAQPAWASKKYKDILPVDTYGNKRHHGGRSNFCPNSSDYRRLSSIIASKMAEHYKENKAIVLWHINNEYGTYCYCENCRKAFILWLKEKYKTLENLNDKWNTTFWSHTYYEWDEIEVPSALSEILPGRLAGRDGTNFQGMAIDYKRFMSNSILGCFINEKEAIREHMPDTPVTTNIWGISTNINLFEWAKHYDIASWDNYPSNLDKPSDVAFRHSVVRGLKKQPFLIMEQTPNQQNWQDYNALKRPGVMRLLSYQGIAQGSDGVMFFQIRQSRGACEKYHAAIIPHVGNENTRIGRELMELGNELNSLSDIIIGSNIESKVAIIMDWDNWWAVEYSSGPSVDLKYLEQIQKYYGILHGLNTPVDIVQPDSDLSEYKIVIAPILYMVSEKNKKNIESFVRDGGTFITTFFSGIVDENDLVILGGYPGAFRDLLGIWVEETDALYPDMQNYIKVNTKIKGFENLDGSYKCNLICDVVHLEGAKEIATYETDFYKNTPVITENDFGNGKAIYLASNIEDNFIKMLMKKYLKENNINGILEGIMDLEITKRTKDGVEYIFILNHKDVDVEIDLGERKYIELITKKSLEGRMKIKAKDVWILK
ncbi:beta-galactosidase [Clostridium sp. MB05]